MKTIVNSLLILSIFIAGPVSAQSNLSNINPTEITIDLSPEFPKPGEQVTATLNDYSGGAYGSSVNWIFDGQEITEAKNQRQTTFTAGANGVTQTIEVVLQKTNGSNEVIETSIKPIYLDIIIEPQTRVPDFYLGRALPSIGSTVNATALISGEGFRNPDLIYTWKVDNKVIEGGALRARNKISFTVPRGSNYTLMLEVTDLTGKIIAKRAILLPSVKPEILFYENNSLFGISTKAISKSFPIVGQSVEIKAEPYYLDSNIYNSPSYHQWKIDGVVNTNINNPYVVTLQKISDFGSSNLDFEVRDTKQVLQGAEASLQINF